MRPSIEHTPEEAERYQQVLLVILIAEHRRVITQLRDFHVLNPSKCIGNMCPCKYQTNG